MFGARADQALFRNRVRSWDQRTDTHPARARYRCRLRPAQDRRRKEEPRPNGPRGCAGVSWQAEAICVGEPQRFRGEELSAFAKVPLTGPVRIMREGLEGDHQADRKHHGGVQMALHLYPLDHHAFWHRSEEHTSELQSLMRISYAVFCLKKKKNNNKETKT